MLSKLTPCIFSSQKTCKTMQRNFRQKNRSFFTQVRVRKNPAISKKFIREYADQFKLADIGEGIAEVELLEWSVKVGDKVSFLDPICQVQSDKAVADLSAPYDGVITKVYYEEGDIVKVGSTLVDIDRGEGAEVVVEKKEVEQVSQSAVKSEISQADDVSSYNEISTSTGTYKVLAAPAVRYLAKKTSTDLSKVKGSGKDGRVTKGDLLNFLDGKQTEKETTSAPQSQQSSSWVHDVAEDRVVKLKAFNRVMAQSMNNSLKIPHFGYYDEVQMDSLIQLRARLKPIFLNEGIKLSYLPFFIKAASLALKQYPLLNSRINEELTEITYIGSHNISIAVDTPSGLAVPCVKNVQNLTIKEIAKELNRIIASAAENKLKTEDITGGTFTLSNIGSIGGTYASPVISAPQVCIGALGKMQKLPRYDANDNVVPQNFIKISWSGDHRVIDGASMANFSNLWKQYLEYPETMVVDMK